MLFMPVETLAASIGAGKNNGGKIVEPFGREIKDVLHFGSGVHLIII